MNRCFSVIVFLFLGSGVGQAQIVWPGDINDNGKVSAVDLLYWGVANGSTGPQRSVQSTDWSPQTAGPLWSTDFANGINYAFADCDGNGVVDEADFDDVIEENFGREQGGMILPDNYANATGELAPELVLNSAVTTVEPGAVLDIDLSIVDDALPVDDFYGIALKISYSTGLLEGDDGPDFDFLEGAWFEGSDEAYETLYVDEDGTGRAELGLTRTNQIPVPVEPGKMGSFNIIVEDIIVGLERQEFILRIDSVLLIGPDQSVISTHTDSIVITIVPDTSKLTSVPLNDSPRDPKVSIFPNPTRGNLMVRAGMVVRKVFLLDPLGRRQQIAFVNAPSGQVFHLNLPRLPSGHYWVELIGDEAVITRKVLVVPPD